MSRFSGWQTYDPWEGTPRQQVKRRKRAEAEARNARTHPDDRRVTREPYETRKQATR